MSKVGTITSGHLPEDVTEYLSGRYQLPSEENVPYMVEPPIPQERPLEQKLAEDLGITMEQFEGKELIPGKPSTVGPTRSMYMDDAQRQRIMSAMGNIDEVGLPEITGSLPVDMSTLPLTNPRDTESQQVATEGTATTSPLDDITAAVKLAQQERMQSAIENREKGGQQMLTSEGLPMTEEQKNLAVNKEIETQEKRLPIADNVYDYMQGTVAGDPDNKMSGSSNLFRIQKLAKSFRLGIGRINFKPVNSANANVNTNEQPASVSVLSYLKDAAQVSRDADIMNAMTEESLAIAAEAVRDPDALRMKQEEITSSATGEAASVEDIMALAGGGDAAAEVEKSLNPEAYNKPMPIEAFTNRLGTKFKRNLGNKKIVNGLSDNTPLKQLNNGTIGQMLLQPMLESQFVRLTDDGKSVVLAPRGIEAYQAAKRISNITRQMSEIKGDISNTPAPYNPLSLEIFHSFEPLSPFRSKKFKRYSKTGNVFSATKYAYRANTIRGRSARTTEPTKVGAVSLMMALAQHGNTEVSMMAQDFLDIGSNRLKSLGDKTEAEIKSDIQDRASTWLRTAEIFVDSMESNIPFYVRYNQDDYSGRPYSNAHFGAFQGNLPARHLLASAKKYKNLFDFGKTNLTGVFNALKNANANPVSMKVLAEAAAKDILNNPTNVKPQHKLLFSLMSIQTILDNTIDSDNTTFRRQIEMLNMDKIKEYARHGRVLRQMYKDLGVISPDGNFNRQQFNALMFQSETDNNGNPTYRAAMSSQGTMPAMAMQGKVGLDYLNDPNSEQLETLKFITQVKGIDHKNFGQVFSVLEDAARFMDAIQTTDSNGNVIGRYIPSAVLSMDMKMAGSTAIAFAIGDVETIMRSGIHWEISDSKHDIMLGISHIDDNRVAFTKEASRVLEDDYHVERIFKKPTYKSVFDARQIADAWAGEFGKNKANTKWAKSLAKAPKMTTQYGRPAMSHFDSMFDFLNSDQGKSMREGMMRYYDTVEDMATDLASVVEQTLYRESGRAIAKFLKEAGNFLGIWGMTPTYQGYFGNDWEAGATMQVDDELQGHFVNENGTVLPISTVKSELDMGARKEPKEMKVWDLKPGSSTYKKYRTEIWTPPKYSGVSLSILPQAGQAAESEGQTAVINAANPTDKDLADPRFVEDVFDNLSGDLDAMVTYAGLANSYNGPLYKVFAYDRAKAMVEGYEQRKKELGEFFVSLAKEKGQVNIGLKGDFTGLLHQGDNVYADIQKMKDNGEWNKPETQYWTKRLTQLKEIFDAMGYQPDDGRNRDEIIVPAKKFQEIIYVTPIGKINKHNPPVIKTPVIFALDVFYELTPIGKELKEGKYKKDRDEMMQHALASRQEQMLFMMIGL